MAGLQQLNWASEGVGATAAALVDLSTVAGNKISNPPWVKFQSAGWVNFPSAPTASASDAEATQRFIADVLRVILAVAESGVAVERAITWFRLEPLPTFEQQTAEQLVSQGQIERVLQFLASWQTGSQG
ncbi:hypothetical protein PAE81_30300 [Pseudomonas aeruginosa]|uniref:hypothetical protein n=1 Tax=Pseudomonas aeruginosa TaxID=287 RepID=UPI0023591E58